MTMSLRRHFKSNGRPKCYGNERLKRKALRWQKTKNGHRRCGRRTWTSRTWNVGADCSKYGQAGAAKQKDM